QGSQERPQRAPGGQEAADDPPRQAREVTAGATTLGLLAGGRATRLGGIDKAWIERDGVPQALRLAGRVRGEVDAVLASANRNHDLFAAHGIRAVADRVADLGPLGALDALAA